MDHDLIPVVGIIVPLLGLPWLIFHYITQWKKNASLTVEDENLLDELHGIARRLDDRMNTIERIVAADSPSFRPSPSLRATRDEDDTDFELPRSTERPTRTRRREH